MVSFSAPSSKASFRLSDLEGHLLAIEIHAFKPEVDTANGRKPAVEVTIHDIDDEITYENKLLFNAVLVYDFRTMVDRVALGVLVKGDARPGQHAPWKLDYATGDPKAVRRAEAYVNEQC